MRAEYYLFFIGAVLLGEKDHLVALLRDFTSAPLQRKYLPLWLTILIVITSGINKMLNGHEILCTKDYYSSFVLLPFLLLTASLIKDTRFFKVLVVLTAAEVVVAGLEYFSGVRLIVSGDSSLRITDYSLLYNSRVYGLSPNSSLLAYKVLIAFILIDLVRFKTVLSYCLRTVLIVGLILSFSRSVIIVMIIYWFLKVVFTLVRHKRDALKEVSVRFGLLILVVSTIFFKPFSYQFLRGDKHAESTSGLEMTDTKAVKDCAEQHALPLLPGEVNPDKQGLGDKLLAGRGIQTSGRKQIWINYLNFIADHPWFGNGSDKLMFLSWDAKGTKYKLIHAHNSFLQLLASNGILITLLYLLFYGVQLRQSTIIPVITIVLYSCMNYGIFWGFSCMDLILLILLAQPSILAYEYEGKS
jgi:hypothetical protein